MAKVVIIGAGFAGHTAAIYLGNKLGRDHEITMINKYNYFLYLPSLVWVGVGHMGPEKVRFPLMPVCQRIGVRWVHGTATEIYPDDNYVLAEEVGQDGRIRLDYDYLIIATGPNLYFEGTPGLGPRHGHTHSICWLGEAIQCSKAYMEIVERMEHGEKVKIVVGTGHPMCTCQGAAFEYLMNIHRDLITRRIRDKAELLWLSNEIAVGDFGVGGLMVTKRGSSISSEDIIGSIFKEYDVKWEVQKGVTTVDEKRIYWEDYDGNHGETSYDFAMLLPEFKGQPLRYIGKHGDDVSRKVVNENGLVYVDGFYGLPYVSLQYTPEAWPAVYQSKAYGNIFAAGFAFAPPGSISPPHTTPNGTEITAPPPRTGMISGIIGRLIAKNIIGLVNGGKMAYQERMTEMYAACVASISDSLWGGAAVSVLLYPVVPNFLRFPNNNGRDERITHIEAGLSGAWIKRIIHTTMLYKMRSYPGWQIIPE